MSTRTWGMIVLFILIYPSKTEQLELTQFKSLSWTISKISCFGAEEASSWPRFCVLGYCFPRFVKVRLILFYVASVFNHSLRHFS